MALTPCGVNEECADLPCTRQRYTEIPLCALTTFINVGSPTIQYSGAILRAAKSASSRGAPKQPTSSSNDKAMCRGRTSSPALDLATANGSTVKAQAIKPFISQAPRPYNLSPRISAVKGSDDHS